MNLPYLGRKGHTPMTTSPIYGAHAAIIRDFQRAIATSAPRPLATTPAAKQAAYLRACKAAARRCSGGHRQPGSVASVTSR